MSSNFLIWDQPATNAENDAAYAADPQRANGGVDGVAFPSLSFNKFGLQTSGMAWAIAQFLASKGFVVSDSNLPAVAAALESLFANVPGRAWMQQLGYAPNLVCDASLYNGFQIYLAGDTTLAIINRSQGQDLTFQFIQDGGGNHHVNWPGDFYGNLQPDPTALYGSVIEFTIGSDLTGRIATPTMSSHGISGTPIGAVAPTSGAFTTLSASASAVVPTVGFADNSANAINSAWAKFGFSFVFAGNGYFKFPSWLGGLMLQWGLSPALAGSANSNSVPVGFSRSFANVFSAVATANAVSAGSHGASVVHVTALNINGFTLVGVNADANQHVGAIQAYWFAVGN